MEKDTDKYGFYKASYKLTKKVKNIYISVLASKILYIWKRDKDKYGYVAIYDEELAGDLYISTRTLRNYIPVLEEIGFLKTKIIKRRKYYKVISSEIKKYFSS